MIINIFVSFYFILHCKVRNRRCFVSMPKQFQWFQYLYIYAFSLRRRHSDSASAAAVESMTGSEVDGESWETVETEDSSDGGTAEARLLKVKKHANGRILRFGKGGRFVAGINDVLGKGFAGKVYKATDTKTGHQVAVKTELRSARKGTLQIESINYKIIGRKREHALRFNIYTLLLFIVQFYQVGSSVSITPVDHAMENHTCWSCKCSQNPFQNY